MLCQALLFLIKCRDLRALCRISAEFYGQILCHFSWILWSNLTPGTLIFGQMLRFMRIVLHFSWNVANHALCQAQIFCCQAPKTILHPCWSCKLVNHEIFNTIWPVPSEHFTLQLFRHSWFDPWNAPQSTSNAGSPIEQVRLWWLLPVTVVARKRSQSGRENIQDVVFQRLRDVLALNGTLFTRRQVSQYFK